MLAIQVNKLGKKFNREWIFRNLSYDIKPGQKLAILGGNGSGKSTFLQLISGFVTPNEGGLVYSLSSTGTSSHSEEHIPSDKLKNHVAFASPYLQLIEELTLEELVSHIGIYKPFAGKLSGSDILEKIELSHAAAKPVKQFSSGMKQRLKLGLALLSDTPLLLLDEPVSNLDRDAIAWYQRLIMEYTANRTVLVCSNAISDEYFFCTTSLNISDYKPGAPKI